MRTVIAPNAERMMTRVDWEDDSLEVSFADGRTARIAASSLKDDRGRPLQAPIRQVSLIGFHELLLETADGASAEVPWDYVRHLTGDPGFVERERVMDEDGRRVLGKRIQGLRKARGLSQAEAARRAGVGRVTLARLEKGEQSPTLETLERLSAGLALPLARLLGG